MGDINHVKPMEKQYVAKLEDLDADEMVSSRGENSAGYARDSQAKLSKSASVDVSMGGGGVTANASDIDNIIIDEMVDINKFRF